MLENILFFALSLNKDANLNTIKNNVKDLDFTRNRIVEFMDPSDSYFNTKKINKDSLDVENNFKSGMIFDYNTGEIYWKKNIEEKRSIASLTKMMTVLTFLDLNVDLYKYVKVTSDIAVMDVKDSAAIGFTPGEEILIKDVLYSGYIGSKNDAINLLVKSTDLSYSDFVIKMNEKAKSLDLKNTVFTNVNGLDDGNVSTAEDLSKLAYYAFSNKVIDKLSQTEEYTFKSRSGKIYKVKNTNKLLGNGSFTIIAGKTGYLDSALYCLTLFTSKDQKKLISILLGNDTEIGRFSDAEALNSWVYRTWK